MSETLFCLFESYEEEVEMDQMSKKTIRFRPWGVVNEVRQGRAGKDAIGIVYRTPLGSLRRLIVDRSEVDLIETNREHWSLMFELIMWKEDVMGLEGPSEGTLVH